MKRGVITSWKTNLEKTPHIGDKLRLPTLVGMANFTVTQLEGDRGVVESGNLMGHIKREDGQWSFNHCLIDKNMKIPVAYVNNGPPIPSPMNPHIGTRKTYK